MSYNSWSNRETWLVSVWMDPESRDDVLMAKDYLEEQFDNMPDGPLKDMIDFNSIAWDELLATFSTDDEEESDEEE